MTTTLSGTILETTLVYITKKLKWTNVNTKETEECGENAPPTLIMILKSLEEARLYTLNDSTG